MLITKNCLLPVGVGRLFYEAANRVTEDPIIATSWINTAVNEIQEVRIAAITDCARPAIVSPAT